MPPIERSFPAETLRAFRAWLGLSQGDLASILGISTRSVQAYEELGGPEWLRYALMGWATLVHGATPRAAARRLGLPWEQHALAEGAADARDAVLPGDALDGPYDSPPNADEDGEPGDAFPLEEFADMPSRPRRGTL